MRGFLSGAWLLARKDLRIYFRDRTGMLLGFLLPIALVTAFGFVMKVAFGSGGDDAAMPSVRLWVADLDHSEDSLRLVDALRTSETVSVRPESGKEGLQPKDLEEARTWIAEGENDAHHVLVIPSGYGAAVAAGALPELQIVRDPRRPMESRLVSIGVMQGFMSSTQGRLWPALMGRSMAEAGMNTEQVNMFTGFMESARVVLENFLAGPKDGGADPEPGGSAAERLADFTSWMSPASFVDVDRGASDDQLTYQLAQVVAGMTVMMLMFGLMACATTLIEEREKGMLRRLFVAPIARESVLFSKMMFAAVIGVTQLAVLLTYGEFVFHVSMFRDPLTLLLLSLSTVVAVTAFGILIAALARTQKQAEGMSTLLILVMSALGGAWFPLQFFEDSIPLLGRVVMRLTLTHWSVSGFQQMLWYQKPWSDPAILTSMAVLWGFGLLATAGAWAMFHRRHLSH